MPAYDTACRAYAPGRLLLEHLLEDNFETFFTRTIKRIEAGSRHMRSLLPGCWGLTKAQERRVTRYLRGEAA